MAICICFFVSLLVVFRGWLFSDDVFAKVLPFCRKTQVEALKKINFLLAFYLLSRTFAAEK
jgi:hypothetical protein